MEEMQEVWENGGTYGDDAYYDTCQHAWRLLEAAVAMSNPVADRMANEKGERE